MKTGLIFLGLFLAASALGADSPSPVRVPGELRQRLKSFEPSAGVYLPEAARYLVSSDDTTEEDSPWLFLLNESGQVERRPVQITGVDKMTDIESLSRDAQGSIFILCSQGLNKNGREKRERNLFVRAKLGAGSLQSLDVVELRPLLLQSLLSSSDPVLARMRSQFRELLDVESHFIRDGELYVGLKAPQPAPSQAVVVKLGRWEDVFLGRVEASLWGTLDLRTPDGLTNRLSDMSWRGNELWVTSTSEEGMGRLWMAGRRMQRARDFQDAHPEGLVARPDGRSLLLFDDSDRTDGLFLHLN